MNILIVSFDRSLVNRLKEALSEHHVVDVKNGEEAINTVSSYMDVVIYDAVSGSISEEDINNMYRRKFKDSKYVVLVDDLFPVDMNNIIPPQKVKVMRDEAVERINAVLFEEPAHEEAGDTGAEDIAYPPFFGELPEPLITQEAEPVAGKKKLLLVSFDEPFIDSVNQALSERVEIIQAKNIKEAMEKAWEADVILFDTISGMLAYRTLMDMSKDQQLASKPYVLLIDELFTIDVESIPLKRKYTFARETEFGKAMEKVLGLLEEPAGEGFLPEPETPLLEEAPTVELQPSGSEGREEDTDVMTLLEEIIAQSEEGMEQKESVVLQEFPPEVPAPEQEPSAPEGPRVGVATEELGEAISRVIREELSQEKIYSALSLILSPEEVNRQISGVLEERLGVVLREVVGEVLSRVDVSQILREEARRVLRERLNELIT